MYNIFRKLKVIHIGTYAGWFQQLCSAAGAFLALPIYVKYLGQTSSGQWLTFQSLFIIAGLSDFGISYVTSRQVATCLGQKKENDRPLSQRYSSGWQGVTEVFFTAKATNYITCLLLISVSLLFALIFKSNVSDISIKLGGALPIGALSLSIILKLLGRPYASILDGCELIYLTRFLSGAQAIFIAVGCCVLAAIFKEIKYLFYWTLLLSFCETIALYFLLKNKTPLYQQIPRKLVFSDIKALSTVAIPLGIVNLGGFLLSSIQLPMIAMILGPQTVAPYYVAQRISQFFNVGVMQTVYPYLPLFTRNLAANSPQAALVVMKKVVNRVHLLSIIGAFIYVVGLPFLCIHFFKVSNLSEIVILLLALDMLFSNMSLIYGHFVLASGINPIWKWVLFAGAINTSLLYFLLPKLGIIAIPIVSLFAGAISLYSINLLHGLRLFKSLKSQTA